MRWKLDAILNYVEILIHINSDEKVRKVGIKMHRMFMSSICER